MKVVIESIGKQIVSDYCFKGWIGACNAGHVVELLSHSNASMQQERLKEEMPMPIGSVGYMEYFFNLYGIDKPLPLESTLLHFPDIQDKLGWDIVENRNNLTYPVFAKPAYDVKKFTGSVFTKGSQWNLYPELQNWNEHLIIKQPFSSEIVSEWRCFVNKGKVINCSFYSGRECRAFPDRWSIAYIKDTFNKYLPLSYTIDVAVLEDGSTKLIEFNDMWAVGPYGCNEDDYFQMLKDRWNEIRRDAGKF